MSLGSHEVGVTVRTSGTDFTLTDVTGWSRSSHTFRAPLGSDVHDKLSDTYESGGVVVTSGLGISVSLQYRVCLDDLVLQGAALYRWGKWVWFTQRSTGRGSHREG